jgi:hypothetical protein
MSRVKSKHRSSNKNRLLNIVVAMLLATFVGSFGHQTAAEIAYSPVLPQFGGTNGQALTVLQYDLQLKSAADAKKKAEALALAKAMEPVKPPVTSTDRLISSIEAALQVRLANNYAEIIFATGDTPNGLDGVDIPIGDTTINYRRVDGELNIVIKDDMDVETTFTIDLNAG